jgi:hypothetical protein
MFNKALYFKALSNKTNRKMEKKNEIELPEFLG